MLNLIKSFLLLLLLLIATAIPAAAKTVTLDWVPSPSAGIDSYKVYYRTDTPTFPFNGTSLSEGASPIVVDGSTTSLAVDLPEDGSVYYFTITATNSTSSESSFSNIVASEWIPYLLAPTDNAAIRTAVTFVWDRPPSDYNVSFDLYYGTDPNLDPNAMAGTAPTTFNSNWPQFKLNVVVPLAILLSLLLAISSVRTKRLWRPVRVGFCIGVFVLQASCGGGGGGDDAAISPSPEVLPSEGAPSEVAPVPPPTPFTNVVPYIYGTEYQITALQPDTKYYWKVVAVDNWGNPYESLTYTFTTLSN